MRPAPNFRAHVALLVPQSFRPQIISPSPSEHISTTTPKVKESPWLSEDSANTNICFDSDRDNRKKNTNACVTSAEPEFAFKHEAFKGFPREYSHLPRKYLYLVSILAFTFIYKHNITIEHKSQYFLDLKQEEKLKQLFSDATFPELLANWKQESLSSNINIYGKNYECKCKEILHPGGLFAGKVHNMSSCIEY